MNIAVIEDNIADSDAICSYLKAYFKENSFVGTIKSFSSGEDLLDAFSPGCFDLLILDIYLPGMSGIDVARRIREIDRDCMLVFITISPDFAMDGFQVQAAGYVVKPITRQKMADAMHACRFLFERNSRAIELPVGVRNVRIPVADLIYVEVKNRDTIFHMKEGELKARMPLDAVEKSLGGTPFLRCNRSFIINMRHVDKMLRDDFLMCNGNLIPIRKNNRNEIKIEMAKFIAGLPLGVD